MRKRIALIAALGLPACGPADSGNAGDDGAPQAMAPLEVGGNCAAALKVEPDRESFAEWTKDVAGAREDLTAFARRAGDAFKTAAGDMCREGRLDEERLASFRRLLVQNGSGATETAVYSDTERGGEATLVFQWIFVEDGWNLPEQADIQQGIACWAEPDQPVCLERLP